MNMAGESQLDIKPNVERRLISSYLQSTHLFILLKHFSAKIHVFRPFLLGHLQVYKIT
jgi:hypothetical protein